MEIVWRMTVALKGNHDSNILRTHFSTSSSLTQIYAILYVNMLDLDYLYCMCSAAEGESFHCHIGG